MAQAQKTNTMKRDGFTSTLGVLVATIGSAVGLGNIWKFPYLTGTNGGAAFLVVYLLSTFLVGLPVMIIEQGLGRVAKRNAINTLQKLAPKKQPWWMIGAAGVLSAFLVLAFYTEVAGWVLAYIFKALSGGLLSIDPQVTSEAYYHLVSNPVKSLFWQWIVLGLVGIIILKGVSKGIETTTKRLMPVLFLLLIITGIRSLTLENAMEGLTFLFRPDFSKLTTTAILTAMGLSFFKLSIGMGTMITYGSYFCEEQNIPKTAVRVMAADLSVSLLAGIAIFPAVFSFGYQPDAGPSLLFIIMPSVFASMPMGSMFMMMFFILTGIAATGAMLSLLEVPVAFLNEQFKLSRVKSTILTLILLAIIGSTAALSSSVLAEVTIFNRTFFDLYDFLSQNILMPMGGFFLLIFGGWVWGWSKFQEALSNQQKLGNKSLLKGLFVLIKYITPVLILIVFLNGLKLF
jgi:NSS family neurotransmitter:Na+ symporter